MKIILFLLVYTIIIVKAELSNNIDIEILNCLTSTQSPQSLLLCTKSFNYLTNSLTTAEWLSILPSDEQKRAYAQVKQYTCDICMYRS
jgi:hypothetical protein